MNAMTIAQIANPFIQTVFIVILGLGYYFTIRTLRGQVQEALLARATGGRSLDYSWCVVTFLTESVKNSPRSKVLS